MVKQLYLFRHAEASEKLRHQTDKERELTSAGKQQAIQMSDYFHENEFSFEVIFSSSAVRARQTTALATQKLKIDREKIFFDDELYDASTRTFFDYIRRLDNDYNKVLLVGHNPTLSYLTEYLTRGKVTGMPTAGFAAIQFNIASWTEIEQQNGELLYYIHPEIVNQKNP